MKKIIYLFMALFAVTATLVSCSSNDDDNNNGTIEKGKEFSCIAVTDNSIGLLNQKCQFFFFPQGNYVRVERTATNYVSTLPWNAYAVTASGEKVASVMQANFQQSGSNLANEEYAVASAINGYKGSTTEGSFYVVAIPYYTTNNGSLYQLCDCYIELNKTKKASEYGGILFHFDPNDLYHHQTFEGEVTELTKVSAVK